MGGKSRSRVRGGQAGKRQRKGGKAKGGEGQGEEARELVGALGSTVSRIK